MNTPALQGRLLKTLWRKRRLCLLFSAVIGTLFGIRLLVRRFAVDSSFPGKNLTFAFRPSSRSRGDLNTTTRLDSTATVVTNDLHSINGTGLFSFSNVCIEGLDPASPPITNYDSKGQYWTDTQSVVRVVAYDRFKRREVKRIEAVRSTRLVRRTPWDIHFLSTNVPQSHTMLETTAYFIDPVFPGNLHHFWNDLLATLYTVMKATNRLHAGADNRIVYRSPWPPQELTRYDVLLDTLPINAHRVIFSNVTANTCFRSAVFGTTIVGKFDEREVVNYVLRKLNLTRVESGGGYVTFIQRTEYRFIVNLDELVTAAKSLNFTKVRVVNFESLDVVGQVRVAAESRVMIGIHGAGLQWAVFMPPGSTLVEIAWPQKYWFFFYGYYVKPYGIICNDLTAASVELNWTAYEALNREGRRVPEEERERMLKEAPRMWIGDSVWKTANAVVNKDDLLKIQCRVKKNSEF